MDKKTAEHVWKSFINPGAGIEFKNLDSTMASMMVEEISNHHIEDLPEWHFFDNKLCFLPNLKEDDDQTCIKFRHDNDDWFFVAATPLRVRLEKISNPPTCVFPTLPEQQLRWIREEIETDFRIRVFKEIKAYKGSEAAKEWFADGVDFKRRIEQMIPYMTASEGFIYYKCWFHSQLLGETTMLRELKPGHAVVELERCKHLAIYHQNREIQQMIDKTTYLELFDVSWEDRAIACGWNVDIEHHDLTTVFHLTAKK